MATTWPAQRGIDGEGDREYIAPEILRGQFDKPADIFAFGLIMLEIAANVRLPDNGLSWQRLRSGNMSDVPSLTSDISNISRNPSGMPISSNWGGAKTIVGKPGFDGFASFDFGFQESPPQQQKSPNHRAGELITPPSFMTQASHPAALDNMVRWMISPDPADRPVVSQVLAAEGLRWTEVRRRAGATIFEGNYGPADDVLLHDQEMMDV